MKRYFSSIFSKSIFLIVFSTILAAAHDHDCDECRDGIGPSVHGSTGKWKSKTVPHKNWTCISIEDTGALTQTCEMCEEEDIRYVHTMSHDNYNKDLEVGCICAGYMEGSIQAAEERRALIESRTQRRANWLNLDWKTSGKGNPYLKTRANKSDASKHHIVITKSERGYFSASIDKKYMNTWYPTMDEAKYAAFDKLWPAKIEIDD